MGTCRAGDNPDPPFLDFTMQVFDGVDTRRDGFATQDEGPAAPAKVKAARTKQQPFRIYQLNGSGLAGSRH